MSRCRNKGHNKIVLMCGNCADKDIVKFTNTRNLHTVDKVLKNHYTVLMNPPYTTTTTGYAKIIYK